MDPELVRDLVVGVPVLNGKQDERVFEAAGSGTSFSSQRFKLGPCLGCQTNKVLLQRLFLLPARSTKSLRHQFPSVLVEAHTEATQLRELDADVVARGDEDRVR